MPAHEGAVTGVPVADAAEQRTALWRLLVSVSVVVLPYFNRHFFRMTGRVYLGPLTTCLIFVMILLSNTVCYLPLETRRLVPRTSADPRLPVAGVALAAQRDGQLLLKSCSRGEHPNQEKALE
jgi:hypothetical protein